VTDEMQPVTGWGRVPVARTRLIAASTEAEIGRAVSGVSQESRGLIARGLGRSYGDAAQRSGGTTLAIRSEPEFEWIDQSQGKVRCPSGASIGELIGFADGAGFFVPVTPGTRHVTIGGAVAADIHGKNHHRVGTLGQHLLGFRLLTADGALQTVTPESDTELFNATVGGMGLTGVIVDADIQLMAVPGNQMNVDTLRTPNLEATMTALAEGDDSHGYTVAWVDLASRGSSLGRGVVTSGDHASSRADGEPLAPTAFGIPTMWKLNLVNELTVRAFNEAWFRKGPKSTIRSSQDYAHYFYPLDVVRNWNRAYGSRGFLQYQFVLPFEAEHRLRTVIDFLCAPPSLVSFAVLKRFGPGGEGYLSFPRAGWTLAADIPIPKSPPELEAVLRAVDELVVECGGRVYLAKDSRLSADMVGAMYPRLDAFRKTRERVDPNRLFQSDLSVRLGL
jgi:decaprenylphospho-beta-D-ribofuranose 2-oxidase